MKTSRRGFLWNLGAGTLGAWLAPLLPWKALAQESIRKPFDPRIEQQFLSVCRQCPQGCGVLAEVVGGNVKKLRGNPFHPTNRGTLCARGVSALHLHYNPDRIQQPLRRKGERGAGGWEPIGWDEALELVGEKLLGLRGDGKSHGFALLVDQLGGLEGLLARRFCEAFGTPNYLDLSQYSPGSVANAATVMQGADDKVIFDIRNASYLISFNVPFLDVSRNPIQTWRSFAEFRMGEGRPRGRFVHFSPARDLTAAKADEWIPIKPGTEGAVALGMAYVMLQEGLYDHQFVKQHCQGFDNGRAGDEDVPGFHDHVRQKYKPADVARITGVPVDKIVGLAREFALASTSLALWQDQAGVASQPLSTQMAIHSLNALVGNIDAPGGVLVARTLPDQLFPAVAQDSVSGSGLAKGSIVSGEHTPFGVSGTVPTAFPRQVLSGSPYPIEVLLLYRANPVFDNLNGAAFREALQKIPLSVCVAGIHNDTTKWCDLVLPESHALESWYAGTNYTDGGHPFFNLAEPVVPPRHDTRHVGDVILDLARQCGGPMAESLPWSRFQDVAYAYVGQLNQLKSGDVFGRPYEEIWTRLLQRTGWRARGQGPDDEFWRECLRSGGWWDPIYFHKEWSRSLKTESGRFEFFPQVLWRQLQESRSGQTLSDEEKSQVLPHYAGPEPAGESETEEFSLLVYALPHLSQVESPNQPWLQEISGSKEREHWITWLDINPEEAEHHHLVAGEHLSVESERGEVRVRCRLDHGVQPGTVRMAFGLGHADGGRWMKEIGATPTEVVAEAYDDRAGAPIWQTTRVRIRKA